MPFYVYAIMSDESHRYIGQTPDLVRRLSEHNAGLCHSTKHGYNWRIIHTEKYPTRAEAMKREKWLKSGVGREWMKQNIVGWSPPKAE